jgi:hypothetical protein
MYGYVLEKCVDFIHFGELGLDTHLFELGPHQHHPMWKQNQIV